MEEGQQLLAPGEARKLVASTCEENWICNFAKSHLLGRSWSYARTVRAAVATPLGAATFAMVALLYMGLFLWLSGLLVYNSQLNYTISTPTVYYDLNPKVTQPYLIFIPIPDILLFVNLTAAVIALALSGVVGLNVALLVYLWRAQGAKKVGKGGATLLFSALPTLVQYVGLGCCGTPAFPLLLGMLPSSLAWFGIRLGLHYNLVIGAIGALMVATTVFSLERIRRSTPNATCPGLGPGVRHCTV